MLFRQQKIRPIFQRDSMQCGVASLAMICDFYGRRYTVTQMEHYCHTTRQGVSLKGIMDAAREIGLKTKAGKCSVSDLVSISEPCILHWKQDHFVVLYKVIQGKKFYILDPAKGRVQLSLPEFEKDWLSVTVKNSEDDKSLGIALFFEATDEFYTHIPPQEATTQTFQFLFEYLKRYKSYFINIALGLLVATLLQLTMPFLMQGIVDVGISQKHISIIWLILLGELVVVIARTATDFIRRWLLLHVAMRINISLKGNFFAKLLRLPMNFFEVKLTGDLLQRVGDHSRVQSFLSEQILNIMFTGISIIVFGGVLLFYNPKLFGIFCIFSLLYAIWIRGFLHKRRVLDSERFMTESRNSNCTYEFVSTMQEIKLQDCCVRRRWNWEDVQADLMNLQMKSLRLQQTQEAGSTMINEIKNIVLTGLTAIAVTKGVMTFGEMLAIQYIIGQLNSPIGQLMSFAYAWQDLRISLDRIDEIHNTRDELEQSGKKLSPEHNISITLQNVSFRYDPHDPRFALRNISFTIPPGKTTAIVGASGSGKSTLLKLLLGYYAPEEGEILFCDNDIKEYDIDDIRKKCGVVMQNGVIFSESIERNIACGDGEIDQRRLDEACRIACLDEYISSLPLGYNTLIGQEGVGLSQGQKQRILIARAIYHSPNLLIMDEATNSLDANNERSITENLSPFLKGKTAVIVAHRLSTVRNADNIIVLDEGKVVESGTHQQLIAKRGYYFRLIRNQLDLGT